MCEDAGVCDMSLGALCLSFHQLCSAITTVCLPNWPFIFLYFSDSEFTFYAKENLFFFLVLTISLFLFLFSLLFIYVAVALSIYLSLHEAGGRSKADKEYILLKDRSG